MVIESADNKDLSSFMGPPTGCPPISTGGLARVSPARANLRSGWPDATRGGIAEAEAKWLARWLFRGTPHGSGTSPPHERAHQRRALLLLPRAKIGTMRSPSTETDSPPMSGGPHPCAVRCMSKRNAAFDPIQLEEVPQPRPERWREAQSNSRTRKQFPQFVEGSPGLD